MKNNSLLCALDAYNMLEAHRGVLVGYSGGADSSALLHLMKQICDERGLYLRALHVHHGIRGAEADRDAEFCRKTCERLNIDFTAQYADIPALARESGKGIEETARAYRYDAFARAIENDGRLDCIATAHNADDNAETVIFNLTRGSGIDGLCGIPPMRTYNGIPIIRPLLYATKRDILGYLKENGIEYIFDSTNDDTAYTRNYIRHEIIPALEKINPALLTSVRRMTGNLRADAKYLEGAARRFVIENSADGGINAKVLASADKAISSRAVCELFSKISNKTLERVHVDAVLDLCKTGRENSSVCLIGGTRAKIENGRLYFTSESEDEPTAFEYNLHEGINHFENTDFAVFVSKCGEMREDLQKDNETLKNVYKLSIHTILSSDKINHMLSVRSRRDGDSYVFGGMTRKLKKLYNDRGYSAKKRRETPIFCDAKGIVWVPGFPIADRVKPQDGGIEIIYYYNDGDKFER
ncbi:MAG: tRNA lysidine(34) synthetase TilS [Clostridia bacterium]|nr:tRNA lysidine(34) synthetase TilS [Clostridia bacterium]